MGDQVQGGGVVIDGLYRVAAYGWAAGFVIEQGRVSMCAPILKRKFAMWKNRAVRISA